MGNLGETSLTANSPRVSLDVIGGMTRGDVDSFRPVTPTGLPVPRHLGANYKTIFLHPRSSPRSSRFVPNGSRPCRMPPIHISLLALAPRRSAGDGFPPGGTSAFPMILGRTTISPRAMLAGKRIGRGGCGGNVQVPALVSPSRRREGLGVGIRRQPD